MLNNTIKGFKCLFSNSDLLIIKVKTETLKDYFSIVFFKLKKQNNLYCFKLSKN